MAARPEHTRGEARGIVELLLEIEMRRGRLRDSLQRSLRSAIQDGRLASGTRLPSSRRLAADLGVSRGVVADSYDQLAAECYLLIEPRHSPVVASVPPGRPVPKERPTPRPRYNFVATTPDVDLFPRREWRRAMERALRLAPNDALDYGDHRGRLELRTALAGYLGRVRGVRTGPERIVVTHGFTQALDLVCRVLRARGATAVWIESPSLAEEWDTIAAAGLAIRPIPVDADGLQTDHLPRTDGAAVVLTPAHQFPTGAVLTAPRRHALVQWAQRHRAWIIEDDYDAEFRYDRAAIGAVQGLDPDRVIHIGTASKTLAPGLRLGWMSVPAELLDEVRHAKHAADSGSPALEQLALAHLLERATYDRHVARVRSEYRRRRDRMMDSLARHLPGLPVDGAAAGLHVLLCLPAGTDDVEVARRAAARDVGVRPLSPLFRDGHPRPGLVLGYGRLPHPVIDEAVAMLASAIEQRK